MTRKSIGPYGEGSGTVEFGRWGGSIPVGRGGGAAECCGRPHPGERVEGSTTGRHNDDNGERKQAAARREHWRELGGRSTRRGVDRGGTEFQADY